MIGAIVGDIVGSRFEFNNYRNKDFELFASDSKVTDDSIMTLAVAKAVMEAKRIRETLPDSCDDEYYAAAEKLAAKYMQQIGQKYPN